MYINLYPRLIFFFLNAKIIRMNGIISISGYFISSFRKDLILQYFFTCSCDDWILHCV